MFADPGHKDTALSVVLLYLKGINRAASVCIGRKSTDVDGDRRIGAKFSHFDGDGRRLWKTREDYTKNRAFNLACLIFGFEFDPECLANIQKLETCDLKTRK